MSDLDLIEQLGELLGRPLEELPEARFERHAQTKHLQDGSQERITRDAYCLGTDGTVSGLFLQPVTSRVLFDFSFNRFRHLRYLYLDAVNLPSYSFLSKLTALTMLSLSCNRIVNCFFLTGLTDLTTLDLSHNMIVSCIFLCNLI